MFKVFLRERLSYFLVVTLVGSLFVSIVSNMCEYWTPMVAGIVGVMFGILISSFEHPMPKYDTAFLMVIALGFCFLLGAGTTLWHFLLCRFAAPIFSGQTVICGIRDLQETFFDTVVVSWISAWFIRLYTLVQSS